MTPNRIRRDHRGEPVSRAEINDCLAKMEKACNRHPGEDWYTVYDPYKGDVFIDYEMSLYDGRVYLAHGRTDSQYTCNLLASPIHVID